MAGTSAMRPYMVAVIAIAVTTSFVCVNAHFDYKDALTKSLLFLEAQRSGKLPPNNRIPWRGDSALDDGKPDNVDLVGGYYDAGDNVKYGLPMAFTVTTLAMNAVFYHKQLQKTGEWQHTLDAIKWGTDFFLKSSIKRNNLYVQVGDPVKDHECWVRPENMRMARPVLKIHDGQPGTEIAAEVAAAFASSSMVFRSVNKTYSRVLLKRAKNVHQHYITYVDLNNYLLINQECPFYCSFSGYNDELMWAATWLYMATKNATYMNFLRDEAISGCVAEFSWDLKYAGSHILLTKQLFFEGEKCMEQYKAQADSFICSNLPQSPYHQVFITPGGMVHLRDGANSQYVTGTADLFAIYSDILKEFNQKVCCGPKQFGPADLMDFARQQMDYLLGNNPEKRSYMVGFGHNPPVQAHHRGASIPCTAPTDISCPMSFVDFFNKDCPNPNVLTGAFLGGPDKNDKFVDKRWESVYTEPCTYVNSLAVGVLAKLATCPPAASH
ncbi:Endoglucanase 16 [Linum perenne]